MSLQYLNNYRGIAILLVMFSHAASTIPDSHSPTLIAISPLFSNGTLLFVLVAGHFFSALSDNFSYPSFLKNKLKFVVLPYVLLSLPAALIYILKIKNDHQWVDMAWFHTLNPFLAYGYLMGTGAHLGPLWFIPMILLYYIASPIWLLMIRKNVLLPFFLASLAYAMYSGRPANNAAFLQSAAYFLPAYLLGMHLGKDSKLLEALSRHATVGFALSLSALLLVSKIHTFDLSWKLPVALTTACFLIALCKNKLNQKMKWLDLFARLSFYLFFVHGYVAGFFRIVFKNSAHLNIDAGISFFVFVCTIFICIAAYIPLKMILKERSKFILGA